MIGNVAPSQATIDLSQCTDEKGFFLDSKLTIHLKAKDGTTYDQTWNIANGTKTTVVRDMVVKNMQQANWSVSTSSDAIIISGHIDDSGTSGVTEVKASTPTLKQKYQPGVRTTDGVKVGQMIDSSTSWGVSFAAVDGTNPTMTEDATFILTVDSTTVNVSLTSGMTISQAAQALYDAMVSAGFSGVSLNSDDSGVTFLNNTSGSLAINVNESWSDNSTDPNSSGGGLSGMIDIANVTVS